MRHLSERAINYLQKLDRDKDAIVDRKQIEQYFQQQGVPIFDPVVDFGVSYSGFTFKSKTKKSDSFSSFLVWMDDIKLNRQFNFEKQDNGYLFYCGQHETAQFYFYIDQEGQFCSNGHKGANILSSTFDVEVEQYAYKDGLNGWIEYPYFYNLINTDALQLKLASSFDTILECTDIYNRWFSNDNIIIQKGIWLDNPTSYLHFYGKTNDIVEKIVDELKKNEIIKTAS